jgi:hypothetical protein
MSEREPVRRLYKAFDPLNSYANRIRPNEESRGTLGQDSRPLKEKFTTRLCAYDDFC